MDLRQPATESRVPWEVWLRAHRLRYGLHPVTGRRPRPPVTREDFLRGVDTKGPPDLPF